MNYFNNNEYESRTQNNNKHDSEGGDTDGLGNSQHLDDLVLDKVAGHEDRIMLTIESCKYTSISVNESTNINNFTSSLFL